MDRGRLNTGAVCSNPVRGMDVLRPHFFVQVGARDGSTPIQAVVQSEKRIHHFRSNSELEKATGHNP
jgi:hypothetical protein